MSRGYRGYCSPDQYDSLLSDSSSFVCPPSTILVFSQCPEQSFENTSQVMLLFCSFEPHHGSIVTSEQKLTSLPFAVLPDYLASSFPHFGPELHSSTPAHSLLQRHRLPTVLPLTSQRCSCPRAFLQLLSLLNHCVLILFFFLSTYHFLSYSTMYLTYYVGILTPISSLECSQ